jgi:hypothetical protein
VGRVYTVEFDNQTIANASGDYDLVELTPADDKPIRVLRTQLDVTSELGDAQEEHGRLRWIRGHATTGNGTATTPRPVDPNDAAAGFTAETIGSTIASAGTAINHSSDGFNVRAGYTIDYDEKTAPKASQADTLLVLRWMNTATDDLSISGTITVEEL